MILGAGLLTFLLHLAVPKTFSVSFSLSDISAVLTSVVTELFDAYSKCNIYAITATVIAIVICPHIGMSGADFKNTFVGTIFVMLASFTVPYVICGNFPITYGTLSTVVFDFVVIYAHVLTIGLIISLSVLCINKTLYIFMKQKGT